MNKEELTLLGTLGAVGALIGIAKLLVSDEPLKPRQVIGRALLHAGLGVASAGILVLIPGLGTAAIVGIACVFSSLGTSALEAALNKYLKK
ncbi:hypothetical protein [Xanthomonas citri]|uniref:hypothetical protein n=1 Tax=Xanthomonas citri TaxID=346 RepID=UPI0024DFD50B|nr:hypothetical protein [Xanthomonas citri]